MSILDLPSEIHVKIATYLGTTKNLANFKISCVGIYSAIESEKVDRKRLPHLKIQKILFFGDSTTSKISVLYHQKHAGCKTRYWDYSDPFGAKLQILSQHLILEDSCDIEFWNASILNIRLLESLLAIRVGSAIRCAFRKNNYKELSYPTKLQKALPFIEDFLKKVQPVEFETSWSHIPLDETLEMLENLKRLIVYASPWSPSLTGEDLLPHVGRPNFIVKIYSDNTNISVDGFEQIVQAWKAADLTSEQNDDTNWMLALAPCVDSTELTRARIRNRGQILSDLPRYKMRFKNDIRPEQTLTIAL